jgi:PD-(D/E)XK nuclease superfamily
MSDPLLDSYATAAALPLPEPELPPSWAVATNEGKVLDHLSPSSLGMARRCLEQFRRRYILGEKERPGEAAVIGTFVHKALEWNYEQKIESFVDYPIAQVIEYLDDEAIPAELETRGGVEEINWDLQGDPLGALDAARDDARRLTSAYYRAVVPRVQPIAVEQKIRVRPPQLPVTLLGYIDLETEPRIIDTKTGRRAQTSIKPSWQLQADVYANVVGKPVEYHTISRAKAPTITTPVERGDDLVVYPGNVEQLYTSLGQLAQIIEWCYLTFGPDEPWPTTGRIGEFTQNKLPCAFCGWRSTCIAWRD